MIATHSNTEVLENEQAPARHSNRFYLLALGALGVVYGDIGTSPLYSLRESFQHGLKATPENILGVLSLVCWSLILVVCVKYLLFVVRADNHGEGGILALAALVSRSRCTETRMYPMLALLGLFGTALLYGDGMITPAISVLSAVEGLHEATSFFDPYIIPITIVILTILFCVQSGGTEKVSRVFGPITLLWFLVLSVLGLYHIVQQPSVLTCLSPHHAVQFLLHNHWAGIVALGSVFLVVTGGEALYADMGHFGPGPIRLAWFTVVFPALLLNYLGQGALIIGDPTAVSNPFYRMVPNPHLLIPVVLLATAATVIASQALISGAFSLTVQAIQLGFLPRMKVDHTSAEEKGQIYVPLVNWGLMVACIALVLGFKSSSQLASAYGVAVTATMLITTLLFYKLLRWSWGWSRWRAGSLCAVFGGIEFCFFGSNILKIWHGGWFPLAVGAVIYVVMATWKKGREALSMAMAHRTMTVDRLIEQIKVLDPFRVPGMAIFMSRYLEGAPPALVSNLKHNHVIHETVLLVSVVVLDQPFVRQDARSELSSLGMGFHRILLRFGYMETPDVPTALGQTRLDGRHLNVRKASYFLGRETLRTNPSLWSGMAHWRERLFVFLARNAADATGYYRIPPDRVVELGAQVEI